MFNRELYFKALITRTLGREFRYIPRIGSTNDLLRKTCATETLPEGTLLLTDHQTAGRGRAGRRWYSGENLNLTFSLLLYPQLSMEASGLISLMAGVAVVDGFRAGGFFQAGLKWPNDILISGRKIGGILAERFITGHGSAIIVGIGINVNEDLAQMPADLQASTTSLFSTTGKTWSREKLLAAILLAMESYDPTTAPADILKVWESYCTHAGKTVKFNRGPTMLRGLFEGLTDRGCARIRIGGKEQIFSSGEIEFDDTDN
ncbi:MAG: biotin--[acetyl-CoA-carboxylase] ligase [FCB group bacterium]|nr:biotin--[acetyl-CoA-carboxylase] ligase [FCB group bacterium]